MFVQWGFVCDMDTLENSFVKADSAPDSASGNGGKDWKGMPGATAQTSEVPICGVPNCCTTLNGIPNETGKWGMNFCWQCPVTGCFEAQCSLGLFMGAEKPGGNSYPGGGASSLSCSQSSFGSAS
nr:hypothetical protein Iba_scaffold1680095CG0010 [Ipomoea batatas]